MKLVAKSKLNENSTLLENKKSYLNKMWITKKCRMNASQRLLDNYWFIQFGTMAFSILLIILTLLSLDINDNKSILLLSASIVLSVFTVYGSAKNYQERHIRMKDNYVKISNLESKLNSISCNSKMDEILVKDIIANYENLMNDVENHLPIDYLIVKKMNDENNFNGIRLKAPKGYYYIRMLYKLPKILIALIWIGLLCLFLIL
jgi:hypothetical protein